MEENHRRIIETNTKRLIEITKYDEMKKLLLEKRVLTDTMISNIEQDNKDEEKRLMKLYEKLTHRGPHAFSKVVDIFKKENNQEALNLLTSSTVAAQSFNCPAVIEGNRYLSIRDTKNTNFNTLNQVSININNEIKSMNNLNYINNNVKSEEDRDLNSTDGIAMSKKAKLKLQLYDKLTSFNIKDVREVKRAESFGSHGKVKVYPMQSKRRGVFFFANIINFVINPKTNRNGAERDKENLVTLFKEMGFKVFYYEDLTKVQLLDLLQQLIDSTYIQNIDSFFLCIQTHGDLQSNQTIMEFSDGSQETTENIISMFSNTSCPALVGKPKIFFFPFCRGKISDRTTNVYVPIETDGKTPTEMTLVSVPKFSDILICYGTVPGFMTHRDIAFGSWYVRELVKTFSEHACDTHIEDMLKLVGNNTMSYSDDKGRTQVSSVETRGFHKLLFLNPKINEE